jgi:hypothetical protein
MPGTIAYSAILQEYIEPLEFDIEADAEVAHFQKCLIGQLVWNFCIALDHGLEIIKDLAPAFNDLHARGPELSEAILFLMARKKQDFDDHNGFILKVEKRFSNGQPTIYCETIPADKMNEIYCRINEQEWFIDFALN